MFSDVIKSALESEVVGQPRAVNGVVRGVTRVVSGLTPQERTLCAYMFMGPPGTGKSHLIQVLARTLHGGERGVVVADCTHFIHGDPWMAFVAQLAPVFSVPRRYGRWEVLETPPLSIVQVEYLERGPKELSKALAAALETGQVMLPEGRRGSLRNCLVFLTSSLCSREILDETAPIGFTGSREDEEGKPEEERIQEICLQQAEEHFGSDLVGRLDGLIVFHRLQAEHLSEILDRRVARLNQWLAPRGFQYELLPAARNFLLGLGGRDLKRGAQDLVRAHRRFVEFPVADLMVSGRISSGGLVLVDRKGDEQHLHFTVARRVADPSGPTPAVREVPVIWEDTRTLH